MCRIQVGVKISSLLTIPESCSGIWAATSLFSCFLKSKTPSLSSVPQFTVKMMNTIKIFQISREYERFGYFFNADFLCEFYFPVLFINIFMWMFLAALRGRQNTDWNTAAAVQHEQAAIIQLLPKSPLLNDFSTLIHLVTLGAGWILVYSLKFSLQAHRGCFRWGLNKFWQEEAPQDCFVLSLWRDKIWVISASVTPLIGILLIKGQCWGVLSGAVEFCGD